MESYKKGAVILMAAGLIVRILGFINRIFMSNIIGAEGLGLFQLISPIYSLIILTLTSGVSISVSCMTARERARGNSENARRIAKTGFIAVLFAGIIIGTLLALLSGFFSIKVLGDGRTQLSLIMLSPCIPIVAAACALKGYFYGSRNVTPTAISQIFEQVVRIGIIFALATRIAGENLALACALVTISSAVGEMANLSVVAIAFYHDCKKNKSNKKPTIRKRDVAIQIARSAMPVSVNRFVTSAMGAIETIMIPARFFVSGMTYKESIEVLGRLSGMVMPLMTFPMLVTSSISTTLVPAIAEAISVKNYKLANSRISRSIKLSFVMGFFFFGVFYVFGNDIANAFYKREAVGAMLISLSFCCILMYVQQTLTGILNGLEKQGASLKNSMIGNIIRMSFIWFAVPLYGLDGYLWGVLVSLIIVSILNLGVVIHTTGMVFNARDWILKPLICGLGVILTGKMLYSLPQLYYFKFGWVVNMAISCSVGGIILILTGIIRVKELKTKLKIGTIIKKR